MVSVYIKIAEKSKQNVFHAWKLLIEIGPDFLLQTDLREFLSNSAQIFHNERYLYGVWFYGLQILDFVIIGGKVTSQVRSQIFEIMLINILWLPLQEYLR